MAKRGKYYKVSKFSFEGFDTQHIRTTEAYARLVQTLFDRATSDVAANATKIKPGSGDKPFSFADYPSAMRHMESVTRQLTANVTTTIERGSRKEWLFACQKNDAFIERIFDTTKLSKATLKKLQNRNLDALNTFQQRKADGMELSQRVWKYVDQWREHIEMAIDAGLGDGTSAASLAHNIKQDLREPNRLFRRVRDKRGILHLSKAAKSYHPGQGVYRSSARNAQRLARTEINMAYRESDFRRWQQLDFIVGIEIARTDREPRVECPLCDRLAGKYPKTFRFRGWHPQCMCHATPILMDEETFDANELGELRAALRVTEYRAQQAKNVVTDVPDNFKSWAREAARKQQNWAHTPYFIRDNFKNGKIEDGLRIELPVVNAAGKVEYHVPFEQLSDKEKRAWEVEKNKLMIDYDLEKACRLYGISLSQYEKIAKQVIAGNEYWRKSEVSAETARLERVLLSEIAAKKKQAEQKIGEFKQVLNESIGWIGGIRARYNYVLHTMIDEAKEKYPNYVSVMRSFNGGSMDIADIRKRIEQARKDYDAAIQDGNECILKYGKTFDVSTLQSLLNEQRTESRYAEGITTGIRREITSIEQQANQKLNGLLATQCDLLKKKNIEHRVVGDLPKELTTQEIIDRLGGGDRTIGSCSSLAFAYAANRGKMDVLDFRGGESQKHFSSGLNIADIVQKVGGVREINVSGLEMMKKTEIGKEYYLAIGRHAAIVRQVAKGQFEYLELQSSTDNGWHTLNAAKFGWRFSARGRQWSAEMVEVSLLYNEPSFRNLMGYINTAQDKQLKGTSGTIK